MHVVALYFAYCALWSFVCPVSFFKLKKLSLFGCTEITLFVHWIFKIVCGVILSLKYINSVLCVGIYS